MILMYILPIAASIIISLAIALYFIYAEKLHFVGGLIGAIVIGTLGGIFGNFIFDFISKLFNNYFNILAIILGVLISLKIFSLLGPKFKNPRI